MSQDGIRRRLGDLRTAEVEAYLTKSGWIREPGVSKLTSLWHRGEKANQWAEVLLPASKELRDYESCLLEALNSIAKFENRHISEVFNRVATFFSDQFKIRIVHADTAEGTIPLNDGILLNERARDLLAASAMSARSRQRHFDGRRTPEARDFLNTLRLGQTEVGSYIVTILAPITQPASAQDEIETTSLTRIVTSTLQSGLTALCGALDDYATSKNPSVFDSGVEAGVSANLCDALIGFSGSQKNREFEIEIQPAASDPSEEFQQIFKFDSTSIENISFAANYYKDDYIVRDVTIQGHVKRLDRSQGAESGTITVDASVRGMEKLVSIELPTGQYIDAVSAHRDGVIVECHGDVHVKARTAKLLQPTNFRILRTPPLF